MRTEDVTFDAHENLTISPKPVDAWGTVPNLECIDTRIRIALNRGL